MIIETTTPFNNTEDAQDSLAGLKEIPGFILGYVTATGKHPQQFHVVTLFDCNHATNELPRQQRQIIDFRSNPSAILKVRPTLHSSIPTAPTQTPPYRELTSTKIRFTS
jgi:hypothetical protein